VSLRFILVFAVVLTYANAAVKQVYDYRLHQPRDRRIHFAVAITPDQDVLSFVVAADGNWRLSRVRGWLDQEPLEQTILVPGLSLANPKQWISPFSAELHVTADGQYVVCVAYSFRRPSDGGDAEVLSIVDLREFKVLTAIHASDLPWFAGRGVSVQFDKVGRVVLRATQQAPRQPGDNPSEGRNEIELGLFALPDLKAIDRCHYSERIRNGAVIRRDGAQDCVEVLGSVPHGPISLDELISELQEGNETLQQCRQPTFGCSRYMSPDGRLESESVLTEHRGFSHPVVTASVENIFSVKTGKLLGSIEIPLSDSVVSRFASQNGRDYLLVMEGGSRLKVYEIVE
jgi:hypothetical protein